MANALFLATRKRGVLGEAEEDDDDEEEEEGKGKEGCSGELSGRDGWVVNV